MTIIFEEGRILGDLTGELAKIEALAFDFRLLADGHFPPDSALASAPLIENWAFSVRPEPCLIGKFHGHPTCHGPISVTSALEAIAPELGWARTRSRFYRLGSPDPRQGRRR